MSVGPKASSNLTIIKRGKLEFTNGVTDNVYIDEKYGSHVDKSSYHYESGSSSDEMYSISPARISPHKPMYPGEQGYYSSYQASNNESHPFSKNQDNSTLFITVGNPKLVDYTNVNLGTTLNNIIRKEGQSVRNLLKANREKSLSHDKLEKLPDPFSGANVPSRQPSLDRQKRTWQHNDVKSVSHSFSSSSSTTQSSADSKKNSKAGSGNSDLLSNRVYTTSLESRRQKASGPPRKSNEVVRQPLRGKPKTASHKTANVGLPVDPSTDLLVEAHPLAEPHKSLQQALKKLAAEDWEDKVSGIDLITRLAIHHPEELSAELSTVNKALAKELKNLRSQVCRSAVQSFGLIFMSMKKAMESDLEPVASLLLSKTGETNKFIREDSIRTLFSMIQNVSPAKSVAVLHSEGASHKNALVRMTTARLATALVDALGPNRVFAVSKDVTEKLLVMSSNFVLEGRQDTRDFAKRIFSVLIQHPDFERAMEKHVPDTVRRNIKKTLIGLGAKLHGK